MESFSTQSHFRKSVGYIHYFSQNTAFLSLNCTLLNLNKYINYYNNLSKQIKTYIFIPLFSRKENRLFTHFRHLFLHKPTFYKLNRFG